MRFVSLLFVLPLAAAPLAAQRPTPPRPVAPVPSTIELEQRLRLDVWRLNEARLTREFWAPTFETERLHAQLLELQHIRPEIPNWNDRALELNHQIAALQVQAQDRARNFFPADPFPTWWMPTEEFFTVRPEQGTPQDSLYRAAREALNRGEYTRASQLFRTFQERFPDSRTAPEALYWRAFALYRAGTTDDLRQALAALQTQRTRYPTTPTTNEHTNAATLQVRINAALAARGDQQAAQALRTAGTQGTTCDREEMEVRAEALNALVQMDASASGPILTRLLAQRDECSVTLRRRAVYILGRRADADTEVAPRLLEVVRNDPDRTVRADAIAILGRTAGGLSVRQLEDLVSGSNDQHTQTAVFNALRGHSSPEARQALRRFIERTDLSDNLRANAITALMGGPNYSSSVRMGVGVPSGVTVVQPIVRSAYAAPPPNDEDAAFLRGLYARQTSRAVKDAIINGLARMGGPANEQWLMQLARNDGEEMRYRTTALSRMRAARYPIEEVVRLYDGLTDRQLRSSVIGILAAREEDAATDKLFEIARAGTDPQIRREAIVALGRKKDPRTTRLLLELVER